MPRRTFFSFHYQADCWRAWNVRNSWVVKDEKEDRGFFDNSVFEEAANKSDDTLKAFLREGLNNTSVTCVLAGQDTWARRWVRYEIVRSVLRGNGLLTVYIDGVKNDKGETSKRTWDPLAQIGLYKTGNSIFFCRMERRQVGEIRRLYPGRVLRRSLVRRSDKRQSRSNLESLYELRLRRSKRSSQYRRMDRDGSRSRGEVDFYSIGQLCFLAFLILLGIESGCSLGEPYLSSFGSIPSLMCSSFT